MSVSFQEIIPSQSVGSFMDASRLTAKQHGLQPDEQALEHDWDALATATGLAGLEGEMYLDIPYAVRNTQQLIDGANRVAGKEVATIWFSELWVPGRKEGGYTHEQLAQGSVVTGAVRMAIFGTNRNEPLLHFLSQPYDGEYASEGEVTQLEEIDNWANDLMSRHPELSAQALSHRGILLIAQNRRNRESEAKMPMEWGYMRDGNLPRAAIDGGSFVGDVFSDDGRSVLAGAYGYARANVGVGLSVGLSEA